MSEQVEAPTVEELVEELSKSVDHTIHILQAIKEEIEAGKYTPEVAQVDYENLMFNDGIDFISIIGDIANA